MVDVCKTCGSKWFIISYGEVVCGCCKRAIYAINEDRDAEEVYTIFLCWDVDNEDNIYYFKNIDDAINFVISNGSTDNRRSVYSAILMSSAKTRRSAFNKIWERREVTKEVYNSIFGEQL